MQLKRSQFLALAAGALMTPLLASCGAKGGNQQLIIDQNIFFILV